MSVVQNGEQGRDGVERLPSLQLLKFFASLAAATLVLTITGPFDTYGKADLTQRAIYWGGLCAVSWGMAELVKLAVAQLWTGAIVAREALRIGIFVPIFVPFLSYWTKFHFPAHASQLPTMGEFAAYVGVICATISFILYGIPAWRDLQESYVPLEPQNPAPTLLKRLPDGFDGQILRLSGDGHYVRVTTTEGEFEVRMRLGDAIAEMKGVEGYTTHRSHWVARNAVEGQGETRGRPFLYLRNGETVPVGAKHQPLLEAQGVLEPRGMGTAKA